jgi:hypothetical protein
LGNSMHDFNGRPHTISSTNFFAGWTWEKVSVVSEKTPPR